MEALKKLLYSFNFQDGGLLFYCLVFGLSIMTHGILKFSGGAKGLYGVGHNLAQFGVGGGYLELGIIAAACQVVGGILIILGLATRLGTVMVASTLIVATAVNGGGGFFKWDYSSQMMFGALMLLIVGPGRYSLDWKHRIQK